MVAAAAQAPLALDTMDVSGPHLEASSVRREKGGPWAKRIEICTLTLVFFAACGFFGYVLHGFSRKTVAGASFECESDVELEVQQPARKGLVVDALTQEMCMQNLVSVWPNAGEKVRQLRLYRAWDQDGDEYARFAAWEQLRAVLEANDARLFLDTQVSCDPKRDRKDWKWAKELLKFLGPARVLAVAVGNGVDSLYKSKDIPDKCLVDLWGAVDANATAGRFFETYATRLKELGDLGFHETSVTTVISGDSLSDGDLFMDMVGDACPGRNSPCHKAMSFVKAAGEALQDLAGPSEAEDALERFPITFTNYPYYDDEINRDCPKEEGPAKPLSIAASAFGRPNYGTSAGLFRDTVARFRWALRNQQPFSTSLGVKKFPIWIVETGWSSVLDEDLKTSMRGCEHWSTPGMLASYYQAFLAWDMDATPWSNITSDDIGWPPKDADCEPPEYVFYSSMRDFKVDGKPAHFGLLSSCDSSVSCKLQKDDLHADAVSQWNPQI